MSKILTIMFTLIYMSAYSQVNVIELDTNRNIIINNYDTLIENNQGTVNVNENKTPDIVMHHDCESHLYIPEDSGTSVQIAYIVILMLIGSLTLILAVMDAYKYHLMTTEADVLGILFSSIELTYCIYRLVI